MVDGYLLRGYVHLQQAVDELTYISRDPGSFLPITDVSLYNDGGSLPLE